MLLRNKSVNFSPYHISPDGFVKPILHVDTIAKTIVRVSQVFSGFFIVQSTESKGWSRHSPGVHKIALLYEIAHSFNFWHAIVARISCSFVQETQNRNHRSSLKTLNNQNNSKILHVIHPKCPGNIIGAKQKVLVTRSINKIWISRWRQSFLLWNAQILFDLTRPMRGSRRAKFLYV
jgi:hypothetical protein